MKRTPPQVGILIGSDSDWPLVEHTVKALDGFGIAADVRVMSAHRTPERVIAYTRGASRRGIRVLIAAAGGAAHLAGVVAAHTALPVIGLPVDAGGLGGLDALLSTVQMPAGVPVATVGVGVGGAVNAAVLAARILALGDPALLRKVLAHRGGLRKKVSAGHARVQSALRKMRAR